MSTALHRTDVMLTALCKGDRQNKLWFGCPVCPEQLIYLFRARLRMEGSEEELDPILVLVEIKNAVKRNYETIRELVFAGAEREQRFLKNAEKAINNAQEIKRRTNTAQLG